MAKIRLIAPALYIDGQTDGMKLFIKEFKDSNYYTFANSLADAKVRFNGGIVTSYKQAKEHINQTIL